VLNNNDDSAEAEGPMGERWIMVIPAEHDAAVIVCQSHFIGAETQTVSHCRKILGEPTGLAEWVLFYANVLPGSARMPTPSW
jgi:hypothetical protein